MRHSLKIRLFIDVPLSPKAQVMLSAGQAHYITRVMRLEPGARIRLFNGQDGEWLAVIVEASRDCVQVGVETRLRVQTEEPGPWLIFAPVKKDAMDAIVTKATELGAERLLPVFTRFTTTQRINLDRLAANVIEAAEQCGRLTIPSIAKPATFDALVSAWPKDRHLYVFDGTGRSHPVWTLSKGTADRAEHGYRQAPGLMIGPEGGLAPGELDALDRLPFVSRVAMGPLILRADTAAVAALASWQALAGAWRTEQPNTA
ncbi:MAG: 16S rRNA (uracil(1498)-N(3))-methyltransferase [Hyphomicrobiales bacterium]|nr:16S rRNA (uracil(1498)-N(3))-methyltransferase [Hyphomicrobiales bacterium]